MKMYKILPMLSLFGASAAYGQSPKPHLILIMTDQHRFDFIGAVNSNIRTPNIDKLCRDGHRFSNGYSTSPSSTPARATLLTGLSPWHHGLLGYSGKISRQYEYAMPRMLSEAGYHTAAVGKMHWTPQRNLHGLDELYVDESGRVESAGFVSDYRQWFAEAAPHLNPDSLGIGWNDNRAGIYPLADTLHPTYWTAMKAIEVIENRDIAKPLFLKVSFARPHSPYDPIERFVDMYSQVDIPEPVIGQWSEPFAVKTQNSEAAFGDFGVDFAVNSRRYYAAAVSHIDEQVGRVVAKLKSEGMYDNSLIVFISDHGDMLGDHHHWRKTYPYEGSTHVPYVVKLPKSSRANIGKGVVSEAVVELRDILPTFLDAAGVDVPVGMDGGSLLEVLGKGRVEKWREYVDLEHAACYNNVAWVALTDGRRKYVWNYSVGKHEYFDLEKDPMELRNVYGDSAYLAEIAVWQGRMKEHLHERGERWVKDGQLQVLPSVLKSPNFKD